MSLYLCTAGNNLDTSLDEEKKLVYSKSGIIINSFKVSINISVKKYWVKKRRIQQKKGESYENMSVRQLKSIGSS